MNTAIRLLADDEMEFGTSGVMPSLVEREFWDVPEIMEALRTANRRGIPVQRLFHAGRTYFPVEAKCPKPGPSF